MDWSEVIIPLRTRFTGYKVVVKLILGMASLLIGANRYVIISNAGRHQSWNHWVPYIDQANLRPRQHWTDEVPAILGALVDDHHFFRRVLLPG